MKKVWIIDDNRISINGIVRFVQWEKIDCEVTGAFTDPRTLLEAAREQTADILISDVCMPGMTGLELVDALLKKNAGLKVILISAYSEFEYVKKALRLNVFDYIEKPLDFAYLQSVILRASEELNREAEAAELLEQCKPMMVRDLFMSLLYNDHSQNGDEQFDMQARFLNIDVECSSYICVQFSLCGGDENQNEEAVTQYQRFYTRFHEDVYQAFQQYRFVQCLQTFSGVTLVLGMDGAGGDKLKESVMKRLSALMEAPGGTLSIVAGVGSIVNRFRSIRESAEKARIACEYHFFLPSRNIIDSEEIYPDSPRMTLWGSETSHQIARCLRLQAKEQLHNTIESIFSRFQAERYTKANVMMCMYSVCGEILRTVYELGLASDGLQNHCLDLLTSADAVNDQNDVKKRLLQICDLAGDMICGSVISYHERLCALVDEYIELHYADTELTLEQFAQHTGMSARHLCAVYKKERNRTISESLIQYRIRMARSYLRQGRLTVREISERVGYANQYYFSNSFKKAMGMSPSQYRVEHIE